MFKEDREESKFKWGDIGDIIAGRPNLGQMTHVAVYRLMQFSIRDILIKELDVEKANKIFYEAGRLAGVEFFHSLLKKDAGFDEFLADCSEKLRTLNVGILRMESSDIEKKNLVVTVSEDLDCSGLPFSDETVCVFDEGFLAGILGSYLNREVTVKEIDCWATGGRICRFEAKVV